MTVRRMRLACWISKATDTHSECVICTAVATVLRYSTLPVLLIVCAVGIGPSVLLIVCTVGIGLTNCVSN